VPVCTSCGRESEEGFGFCPRCGAALGQETRPREERKTVTVLFCDLTGSTALGEALDPEALRSLLARYFERMREILERHGASVEKFIGDAVMAVFGVPTLHEDDALRALRAALEMRGGFPELGIEGRIGIASGEVVTGTAERLATGDAVNLAARLEQTAAPGEILLGAETLRLTAGAAQVQALSPLLLKGKREPVLAYRLLSVAEAPPRPPETPFVGRTRELALLEEAWERVVSERRCELVTVVGEAGIGKSRLVSELASGIEAEVLSGRCLPYGEGITYWPLLEVLRQLDALPSDPAAATALRSLSEELGEPVSAEEIAWGFRKLLEERAKEQPLLCLFDDLQWAEETFLDLLEHLALLSSGAPILVVCMARAELSERRAGWPVALRLRPLGEEPVSELIPDMLPQAFRDEIARRSAGNPLFLIEMAALAREEEGELSVPASLRALLGARLDQLSAEERHLLQCASIEGEVFHRGALLALAPEDAQLTPRLASLVRKELLHPAQAQLAGEDAFRFRHLLLRDTAYEALPKSARASLHERFASWLEERDEVELDELAGYHLEQAARYMQELGVPDPALAERASEHLARGGRRAIGRGDPLAVQSLLERALALTRPYRLEVPLELDLVQSLFVQSPRLAAEIAESAAERAREAGDEAGETLLRALGAGARLQSGDTRKIDELETLARAALPLLERDHDHAGLVHAWTALTWSAVVRCHFEEFVRAAEQALRHSRLAGVETHPSLDLEGALIYGPQPADEGLRTLDALRPDPRPVTWGSRAILLAMLARFDEAWQLAHDASERLHEFGLDWQADGSLALVASLAGDHEAAARHFRREVDAMERRGLRGFLSTSAPQLGRSLCALGRYEEAEPLATLGRELGGEEDIATQMVWRQLQARVLAHRGEHAEAEVLAREAVAIGERTDSLYSQGDAYSDLAEVLAAAGREEEAAAALEQAVERYLRKKNLAMVAQVRPRLAELAAAPG
jgi:class 3 adenylate cyclase/tetratricopeptide (TPR) repeat protein